MSEKRIFIEGNVPSSKNSRVFNVKMKRSFPSKTVRNYIEKTKWVWKIKKVEFFKMISEKEKPYRVGMYFIRDSKRIFDYNNASQIVTDLMVKNGWIEDDNMNCIIPVFKGYEVSKDKAGVEITIL